MKRFALLFSAAGVLLAQETAPLFKIQVTARTTRAVNYRVRSGSTDIDFRGTALLQAAKGRGKVDDKAGSYEVKADFEKLVPPQNFGPEYLTYVLWAITPEGRANNLGELVLDKEKAKIQTATELQAFGMIVTAEPYFAVTTPSNVVVLENIIRDDTEGTNKPIEARFELFERGQYEGANLRPLADPTGKTPNALVQARQAMAIAKWQGAERWAPEVWSKAQVHLKNAEDMNGNKRADQKQLVGNAREAVQTAEDARQLAVKRAEEARLAQERASAAAREAEQKRIAETEAAARVRADQERRLAEAEAARSAAASQQAEAARAAANLRQQQAQLEAERSRIEAEKASAGQLAAQKAAEDARLAKERAEMEQRELRRRLLAQFNAILETRDTVRGLVVNMGDVLFDTGKYTLRPAAREALAKLSGIVLSYPGLRLEVEGHTDSVGGDAFNQTLSEQRAGAVKSYLMEQRVPADILSSRGLGETTPIADNNTAQGRQQNRRVELVVSGEVIGTTIGATTKPGTF